MTKIRQRKYLLAIVALVLVFAGCKGESPTAPTSPGGTGGGVTPPTNATVTLTVSNATPLVNSTTVVTATVTQSNQPVPNGTAVQFATSPLGTFIDTNANNTIHTTTNGVATATLTSSSAGTATITATVSNVSAKTQVTFSATPVTPPPPNTTPTITSISPATGKPAGGDTVTITGTNFVAPVRAIFDFGNGVTKEAQVISVSSTQVQVISPPIDLGTGQSANATITLFINAGTSTEQKVSASTAFAYQAAVLTPTITTLSPTSGPIDGGTRVTIFGSGFQAPVQVFFGAQDAQIINITFGQIIVMSPTARDTATNGSGSVTGPVDVKIININSATSVTATGAFRYTPKMQITAAGPTTGPYTGGTSVKIDGVGFTDPVAVVIGGVAAAPIKVSGTQIIAITGPVGVTGCSPVTGKPPTGDPISVLNVDNGDSANGPNWVYQVPKPAVTFVSPNNTVGGPITVTVLNATGVPSLQLRDVNASITSSTLNADGSTTFTAVVPLTITGLLDANACGGPLPTPFDVTYTSLTTGCTATMVKGALINPPGTPSLALVAPGTFTPFTATITPAVPGSAGPPVVPPVPASVKPSAAQTVNVTNTGSGPLTITAVGTVGAGCASFAIANPVPPVVLNTPVTKAAACDVFPIIAIYNGTTVPGSDVCTVNITTTAGSKSLTLIGTSQ